MMNENDKLSYELIHAAAERLKAARAERNVTEEQNMRDNLASALSMKYDAEIMKALASANNFNSKVAGISGTGVYSKVGYAASDWIIDDLENIEVESTTLKMKQRTLIKFKKETK